MSIGAVVHIWRELSARSPLDVAVALWDAEENQLHVLGLNVRANTREATGRHVRALFFSPTSVRSILLR